ncbi:MAG: hypothetical protein H6698_02645 [Myxococcales bacterium]|nr:hypothetical protein [Myxococcales bacterium]MCB9519881.1 hypothetical protein [Myxococcales bacterium]MCB9533212.1 hypothetical protein [Myxococcales bacterium]
MIDSADADELLWRLVRRLVFDPGSMSRNRNFASLDDAFGRRARRVAAHIRSVRADLLAGATVTRVERQRDGRWCLELESKMPDARRRSVLCARAFGILNEDAGVCRVLGPLQSQ